MPDAPSGKRLHIEDPQAHAQSQKRAKLSSEAVDYTPHSSGPARNDRCGLLSPESSFPASQDAVVKAEGGTTPDDIVQMGETMMRSLDTAEKQIYRDMKLLEEGKADIQKSRADVKDHVEAAKALLPLAKSQAKMTAPVQVVFQSLAQCVGKVEKDAALQKKLKVSNDLEITGGDSKEE